MAHQFSQAEFRRGMLSGAETQAWVEHYELLSFAWSALAPTWLDQKSVANFQRWKMTLPRLGPIFARELAETQAGRSRVQSAATNFCQTPAQR